MPALLLENIFWFNIKVDLETIRFFLPDNKEELDSQKFQKTKNFIKFSILKIFMVTLV